MVLLPNLQWVYVYGRRIDSAPVRSRRGPPYTRAFVKVEVLASTSRVKREGTGELLITNTVNWQMPIIRFTSGDVGTVGYGRCSCGFDGASLIEFYGRDAMYFRTESSWFDPRIFDPIFASLPVRVYKVVQHENLSCTVSCSLCFNTRTLTGYLKSLD